MEYQDLIVEGKNENITFRLSLENDELIIEGDATTYIAPEEFGDFEIKDSFKLKRKHFTNVPALKKIGIWILKVFIEEDNKELENSVTKELKNSVTDMIVLNSTNHFDLKYYIRVFIRQFVAVLNLMLGLAFIGKLHNIPTICCLSSFFLIQDTCNLHYRIINHYTKIKED